jgi:hypothetical protein
LVERDTYLQYLDPRLRWQELRLRPDGSQIRTQAPAPHIVVRAPNAEKLIAIAAFALQQLARALYLSPVLIVLKLVVAFFDEPASDLLVVVFVGIVVLFFMALVVYLFLQGVSYFARGRGPRVEMMTPYKLAGARALGLLPQAAQASASVAPVGSIVRLRGIVTALGGATPRVPRLFDVWSDVATPWRLTRACNFAVCPPDGAPVVVQLSAPPLLIGDGFPSTLALALDPATLAKLEAESGAALDKSAAATALILTAGDEVELYGTVERHIEDAGHFELDGLDYALPTAASSSSYRAAQTRRAMVVHAAPSTPVVIIKR